MKLPPLYFRWRQQKHSPSPPAPTSESHTLVGHTFWWNGFHKGTHPSIFLFLQSQLIKRCNSNNGGQGGMAWECFGTCACASLSCIHLPFLCLTMEAAWVVLCFWGREIIVLSLVSVICLCWFFFNRFIELCSRFYWMPRQVKEWDKERSFYRKRKKDGEGRVKGKSVSLGLLVYFNEAKGTVSI